MIDVIIGLKQVFRYCAFTFCRYLKTQEYKLNSPLTDNISSMWVVCGINKYGKSVFALF